MKQFRVLILGATLFMTLAAQASIRTLKCQGSVFYAKDNKFEVAVTDGMGSSIEYYFENGLGLAHIAVIVRRSSDDTIFKIVSSTHEGGTIRMKVDLTATRGEMISLYDSSWAMEDDKPTDVLGTCRILK